MRREQAGFRGRVQNAGEQAGFWQIGAELWGTHWFWGDEYRLMGEQAGFGGLSAE